MLSHIWGPSHLDVQRMNQLVNSGVEGTTLEATERNISSVILLVITKDLRVNIEEFHINAEISPQNTFPGSIIKKKKTLQK